MAHSNGPKTPQQLLLAVYKVMRRIYLGHVKKALAMHTQFDKVTPDSYATLLIICFTITMTDYTVKTFMHRCVPKTVPPEGWTGTKTEWLGQYVLKEHP